MLRSIKSKYAVFNIYKVPNADKIIMIVKYYTNSDSSYKDEIVISDSKSSEFKTIIKNGLYNIKRYSSVVALDSDILNDYDYTVKLNNMEIKPFSQ